MIFFFFSSRRRHTRFSRDWSSDVCSSDLSLPAETVRGRGHYGHRVDPPPQACALQPRAHRPPLRIGADQHHRRAMGPGRRLAFLQDVPDRLWHVAARIPDRERRTRVSCERGSLTGLAVREVISGVPRWAAHLLRPAPAATGSPTSGSLASISSPCSPTVSDAGVRSWPPPSSAAWYAARRLRR